MHHGDVCRQYSHKALDHWVVIRKWKPWWGLWALGTPATTLQRSVASAVLVVDRPQMRVLVGFGHCGAYPNNMARELRGHLRLTDIDLPAPFILQRQVWNPALHPARLATTDFPILLPHELMVAMYERTHETFKIGRRVTPVQSVIVGMPSTPMTIVCIDPRCMVAVITINASHPPSWLWSSIWEST